MQLHRGRLLERHTRSIYLQQPRNQLLDLRNIKPRQGRARRTHRQSLGITIRLEQPQPSVEATVRLETLEALGGIVQTRRGGRDAQVLEGTQLWGLPACFDGPARGHHVVGAVRVAAFFRGVGEGDGAGGGGAGEFDLGGVEGGHCIV